MPHKDHAPERRVFTMQELRVATRADGSKGLAGHAAVFNRDSLPMYGFTERVAPGAFTKTIGSDDIRALFNHDPNYVLGRNTAKTLRMPAVTGHGNWAAGSFLKFEIHDTSRMKFGLPSLGKRPKLSPPC